MLELTFNHDGRTYDLGTGYGHIAVGVDDLVVEVLGEAHGLVQLGLGGGVVGIEVCRGHQVRPVGGQKVLSLLPE